ncbi:hypothetical protein ACFO1B_47620 [Dactylosporangium siamense]|uniref:hypothetical protein n=1 Tax=Dactylosporangium siamense TaxID=685454 RepID=UPI003612F079
MRYRDRLNTIDAPSRRRELARFALSLSAAQYQTHHTRLSAGDVDDRQDALFLAVVRRDVAAVERALDDVDLLGRALSAAVRLPVSDAALRRLALSAPFVIRRQVYRVLRRSGRRDLAGSLLPLVPARDRPLLLSACSPDAVERWLPALRVTVDDLHRLARVAPVAVARRLVEDGATDPALRWFDRRHAVETALRRDPTAAAIVSPDRHWYELGTPAAVAAALLDRTWWWFPTPSHGLPRLPRRARRTVRRLPAADLDTLARLTDAEGRAALLGALPPARRRPLPGPSVVELMALPFADRVAGARTLLAERPGDPEVLALLPYQEVRDTLLSMTHSHRPDERERGWLALLRSAMLDPDPAADTDAIGRAGRAWTDQHLVQHPVLSLLGAAPARSVTAVPVPVIAAVVHAVLTRPDAAPGSWLDIDEWLTRTLTVALGAAHRQDAGAAEVARAAEVFLVYARTMRGLGPWYGAPRLRPHVQAAVWDLARRDLDGRALLAVAAQLGLDLGDRMRDIALGATDPEIAREAARLWVGGAPADRAERLRTLLEHDPAVARVPEIARLLTTRHTSLLDHAAVRSLRPLLPATAAALRAWRPAQRTWYLDAAAEQATDPSVAPADRIAAVRVLDDPELLVTLAGADDGGVATAALGALARGTQGLTHLAERVDDPVGYRARAAARALRAALDTVTDAAAVGVLTATLRSGGRLAPAKEAVRALGALGTPAAVASLVDAWRLPDLHRDVRATVAATLVPSVETTGGVAELLAAALRPGAQPGAVRAAILATPVERVPADRRPAMARLLVRALDTGDPAVLIGYARWTRYAPEGLDVVARMVGIDHPDDVSGAARSTLGAALGTPAGDHAWAATVEVLAVQADRDPVTVRRRLAGLATTLTLGLSHTPPAARRAAARVLERGLVPCDLPSVRVRLLTHLALGDLAEADGAGPDQALWDRLLDAVDDRPHRFDVESWRGLPRLTEPARLAAVLDHLAGRPGLAAALLWLRLAATQERWPAPQLRRLDELRRHADPDVREAALDVSASG